MIKKTLNKTLSICPVCFKEIEASVIEYVGEGIFLEKECSECGADSYSHALIEKDPLLYTVLMNREAKTSFCNLTLPVTQQCNLSCNMCYAPFFKSSDPLREELEKIVDASSSLWIKITGGEPTVRKDLPYFLQYLKNKGRSFTLVTNGIKLSDIKYVRLLKQSGLKRVALSFLGFNDDAYVKIRGRKLLIIKMRALKNLKKLNIEVVLSVSVVRGINDNEIKRIYRFYIKNRAFIKSLRIRTMSRVGRFMGVEPFCLSELLALVSEAIGFKKEELIESFLKSDSTSFATCRFEVDIFDLYNNRMNKIVKNLHKLSFFIKVFEYIRLFGFIPKRLIKNTKIHLRVWPDKNTVDLGEINKCLTGIPDESGRLVPFCLYNIRQSREEANQNINLIGKNVDNYFLLQDDCGC